MDNYNFWRPGVNIRLTIAAVVAGVAALFIIAYVLSPARRAEIQFAAFAVGAAAAIFSAYHAGITLRLNLYRDRQKRAYEILDTFNRVDSVETRVIMDEVIASDAPATAYKTILADPQKHQSVRLILGVFEDLAIAVRTGYADEYVLFSSLQFAAAHYFDGLKPFIDGVRKEKNNKKFFIELERLVGAWRLGKSLVTSRPLDE